MSEEGVDMSVFITVSEDYTNRNQSWEYNGLFRNHSGEYRVHVRANAHEDQSHATISQWGLGGWLFYTSLPTEDWYADRPSYTKPQLTDDQVVYFQEIRDELLRRFAHARFNNQEAVEIRA